MTQSIKIISNAKTHIGNKRQTNQDAFLSQPESGIWIVADGMGGHHNGEYASGLLTEKIALPLQRLNFDETIFFIKNIINKKNLELFHYAKKLGSDIKCGSTIVCLFIKGNKAAVIWVGDSRLYQYDIKEKFLKSVTRDHTVFNKMHDEGRMDHYHPMANRYKEALTRVVGGEESLEIDEKRFFLKGNERFLLCSDGIMKDLDDTEISQVMSENYSPGMTCEVLVKEALSKTGRDNITASIIDITIV